jgi:hypothetical protein
LKSSKGIGNLERVVFDWLMDEIELFFKGLLVRRRFMNFVDRLLELLKLKNLEAMLLLIMVRSWIPEFHAYFF